MRSALLLALALAAMNAGHCRAQTATDAERARTAQMGAVVMGLEITIGMVATMVAVSQRCGYGSASDWMRVVDAIDRRHASCAARDPYWEVVLDKAFAKQMQEARARGASTRIGSMTFDRQLPKAIRQLEANSASQGCSSFPKEILEGGPADSVIRGLFDMGKDSSWVEASCDMFFPVSKN
ncbi:MAG: hypothetical protein ACK4JB_01115 [Reyranella sp.]